MRLEEAAWLAGLLEAEGCFQVQSGSGRDRISVQLETCDRDVVARAATIMGLDDSRVHLSRARKSHYSDSFRVRAFGVLAESVCRSVRPWLGARRGGKVDTMLASDNLSHRPRGLLTNYIPAPQAADNVWWLSGVLEGECCFGVNQRINVTGRPQISVHLGMTDLDVVTRAHKLAAIDVGISCYRRPHPRKPIYCFRASGNDAERIMLMVRPHMGQRRGAKIDELLAMKGLSHHDRV